MSIYKYFKKYISESGAFQVNPPVIKTETNPAPKSDQEELDEQVGKAGDVYAGAEQFIKNFKDQRNKEDNIDKQRQANLKTQNSDQYTGSKSITNDIEKSGNVDFSKELINKGASVQAQRQGDLADLNYSQHKDSKSIINDLESSNSIKAIDAGKKAAMDLKSKRQAKIEKQAGEQLYRPAIKSESSEFIKKFNIEEKVVPAGTSLKPDVESSISSEIKSAKDDPKKIMAKRKADMDAQKSAQVNGKSITKDVESSNSTDVFTKNGKAATNLTDKRVSDVNAFNKAGNMGSGSKSIWQDLDNSNSFEAMMKSAIAADQLTNKRVNDVNAYNASQNESEESYKGVDDLSGDVMTGVKNKESGKDNDATAELTKKIKAKMEACEAKKKMLKDDEKEAEKKMKRYGKKKEDEKEDDEEKDVKAESQLVTQIGSTAVQAGKDNEARAKAAASKNNQPAPSVGDKLTPQEKAIKDKASKKPLVTDRADALVKSLKMGEAVKMPSDSALLVMKELLCKNLVEYEDVVKKELILNGYINSSQQLTEKAKNLLKTKDVRVKLSTLG